MRQRQSFASTYFSLFNSPLLTRKHNIYCQKRLKLYYAVDNIFLRLILMSGEFEWHGNGILLPNLF